MNPVINLLVGLGSRLINIKKPTGMTNQATVASIGSGTAAYLMMVNSEDPAIQFMGTIALFVSIVLAWYKDYEDDADKQA